MDNNQVNDQEVPNPETAQLEIPTPVTGIDYSEMGIDPVPAQNVQPDPPKEPIVKETLQFDPEGVAMPSGISAAIDACEKVLPKKAEDDPLTEWEQVIAEGDINGTEGEGEHALSEPDRKWERVITIDNNRLGSHARSPQIVGVPTGRDAVAAYRAKTRSSSGAVIVMYGSGFKIDFNPMDNSALWLLVREVHNKRDEYGRRSFGLAMTAQMVYTARAFLDAARKQTARTTLQSDVDLGDAIRVTDFQTLVWGLAQATFDDGIVINRSCMASPTLCNHVATELVLPRRMWLEDRTSLSDEQLRTLANARYGSQDLAALETYQTMFPKLRSREYDVVSSNGSSVKYKLRVPTLNQYIQSADEWINEVNAAVVATIGTQASLNERKAMVHDLCQTAAARQYAHWVESIDIDGTVVTKTEDIAAILGDVVSSDDVELASFFEAIRVHQEASITTLLVLPNWKCPSCGKHQMYTEGNTPEEQTAPLYTPVEAVNTFFGRTLRRLRRV